MLNYTRLTLSDFICHWSGLYLIIWHFREVFRWNVRILLLMRLLLRLVCNGHLGGVGWCVSLVWPDEVSSLSTILGLRSSRHCVADLDMELSGARAKGLHIVDDRLILVT